MDSSSSQYEDECCEMLGQPSRHLENKLSASGDQQSFKSMLENFHSLRVNKKLCDVEIECQGKSLLAHKVILAATIDYFRGLYNFGMVDANANKIEIKEVSFNGLSQIVDFAYTYEVKIDKDNVRELLHAANYLGVNFVKDGCERFLTKLLTIENCLELRELADQHSCQQLLFAIEAFLLENFMELCHKQEFMALNSVSTLERLAKSDDLNITDEQFLFEFIVRWVEMDKTGSRADSLNRLLRFQHPLISQSPAALALVQCQTEAFLETVSASVSSISHSNFGQQRFFNRESPLTASNCLDHRQLNVLYKKNEELKLLTRPRKAGAANWHVGVVCAGPRIYAIGGHDGTEHLSSVECLDLSDESWSEVAPLNVRRRGMAVGMLGGAIYAIGGLDDQNCYKTVERYDIERNEWTHAQEMNIPRGGVAVATYENSLFAVGGNSGTCSLDTCERYDPFLNKWSPIAPMKNRRAGAGVAVIGSHLYVIGGFDDDSPLSTCERYSFTDDSWTEIPPLSCARGGVGVAAMGARIFAIGGHDSKCYLNTVEAYDPLTQKWTDVAPINQRRAGAGVAWSNCSINDITFPSK
uniref:BTB domain-containing protein n=1 Tax=Globodera rostochiensis TaxID=31243 RepID=A0A914HDI9_GLORO